MAPKIMRFFTQASAVFAGIILGASPINAVENASCEATTSSSGWVKTFRIYQWGEQIRLLQSLDHAETGLGFSFDLAGSEQPEINGPDIDAIMKLAAVQEKLKGLPTSEPTLINDDVVFDGDLTIMIDSLEGGPRWTMRGKLERARIYLPPKFKTSYAIIDPLTGTGTARQVLRNLEQGGEFRITITITTGASSMRTLYSQRFDSTGFAELVSSRSGAELEAVRNCPLLQ